MAQQQEKIPLLVIAGPTASGKTALAIELAKAYGGEIVSADSMQIYKGMEIATAKPSPEEMQGVPHHLLGFLEPDQPFSVAEYVALAKQAVLDIHRRGRLPILAGGTGLYIQSLVDGVEFSEEEKDDRVRRELERRVEKEGAEKLLEELAGIDPEYAAKLHPNNKTRVIRAMEIYRKTGITMTEHQLRSRRKPSEFHACMLGLNFKDRSVLYSRIDRRVDEMAARGLVEEARRVCGEKGIKTAFQAIGYKELQAYFSGAVPLEQALETIKRETRRYAKRQLTWFRRDPRIHWVYPDEWENFFKVVENAKKIIESSEILCYNKNNCLS